jgi:hypothetical protein
MEPLPARPGAPPAEKGDGDFDQQLIVRLTAIEAPGDP